MNANSLTQHSSAHIAADGIHSDRLEVALARAGWQLRSDPASDVALVIYEPPSEPRRSAYQLDVLTAVICDAGSPRAPDSDFAITPAQSQSALVDCFAAWLPPPPDTLDRLASALGRSAIISLAMRAANEMRSAIVEIDHALRPDAHKLVATTGTIGFTSASEAWCLIDQGATDMTDARRETRKAIVTTVSWLAKTN